MATENDTAPAPAERIPFHSTLDDAFTAGHSFVEHPVVTIDAAASADALAALHLARLHRLRELLTYMIHHSRGSDELLDIVFPPVDEAFRLAEMIHQRLYTEASHG